MLALGFVVADPCLARHEKSLLPATVPDDPPGTETLAELGRMVLWKGAHNIRLEAV
jgi:hypothetical protein